MQIHSALGFGNKETLLAALYEMEIVNLVGQTLLKMCPDVLENEVSSEESIGEEVRHDRFTNYIN